eukprot:353774-Chlamydomonas_euryale.AAC.3
MSQSPSENPRCELPHCNSLQAIQVPDKELHRGSSTTLWAKRSTTPNYRFPASCRHVRARVLRRARTASQWCTYPAIQNTLLEKLTCQHVDSYRMQYLSQSRVHTAILICESASLAHSLSGIFLHGKKVYTVYLPRHRARRSSESEC